MDPSSEAEFVGRVSRAARRFVALLALIGSAADSTRAAQDPTELIGTFWWNLTNGLPQSSVNALAQTEDGALWLATFGGLLRFDGIEFERFDVDTVPGLDSNRATAVVADGAGGIWFATQTRQILHLRDRRVVAVTRAPGNDETLSMVCASDGAIWTQGSGGGVSRYTDGQWTDLLPRRGAGHFRGLCLRADGAVCVASDKEIVCFDVAGKHLSSTRSPAEVIALAPSSAGGLWVGLADGVARLDGATLERYPTNPPIRGKVHALFEVDPTAFWIATEGGPIRVSTLDDVHPQVMLHSNQEVPSHFIGRSFLLDRENNLWMGGSEAGLLRLRRLYVRLFQPGSPTNSVTAICADANGGAWVGHGCAGVVHIPRGAQHGTPAMLTGLGRERGCVYSLLRDRRGRVWAGVNDIWMRRGTSTGDEFEPILGGLPAGGRAGPLVELPDGDVWIANVDGRLTRIGGEDEILEQIDVGGPVHSLALAPDGALWVGGEGRVTRVAGASRTTIDRQSGLPAGSVRDILVERGGDAWIATYGGGLAHFGDGRVRTISRNEGLVDNSLTRILDDEYGRLWILTNLGLIVAARTDLVDVIDGRAARVAPVVIGPESGMNEANYGAPAGFRDSEGRMWFGLISGPVLVDAAEFPFNREQPKPAVRRVLAEDDELDLTRGNRVPAGTKRLTIQYTAFALGSPERVRFRYRLVGFDRQWSDAGGERQVAYTKLWPGEYAFEVLARNEDGVWSDEPARLSFEVDALWWQTPWFFAGLVLLVSGGLFKLHRARLGRLARRSAEQLEIARARAESEKRESRLREELAHVARVATAGELATSLAHEVNQPLAAIATNAQAGRRFLARDQVDRTEIDEILGDISNEAQRASEVIRRLRDFLRKHQTERRPLALADLVRDTLPLVRRELSDNHVDLAQSIPAELPALEADPVQLQQVLVNLVKNACEAMTTHAGTRRIDLRARFERDRVIVEIEDSGPGLAPELRGRLFEPFATTKPSGMGLGLAICRSIVEAHGGRLTAPSGNGAGMLFRMDLPAANRGPGTDPKAASPPPATLR